MGQKTLFDLTETIKNKPEKKELLDELEQEFTEESSQLEQEIQIGDEIKDDKYGWKQLKDIKGKDVGQHYVLIELSSKSDLNNTKYYVHSSLSSEHPKGMLGSMWGSGGEIFNPEKLDEITIYFNQLMENKKHRLREKYREFTNDETNISYQYHNAYSFFRLIPANNFFVIISDKMINMLKNTGFDFEKWYDEYKALPENKATKKDWELALDTLQLYKKGDKIVNKIENDENDLSIFEEEKIAVDDLIKQLKKVADEIRKNENNLGYLTYSKPYWFELKKYGKGEKDE